MSTTLGRFSARAQRALSLTQSEAQRLNHSHIEPEHVLLALIQLDDCVATKALRRKGADLDQISTRVEQSIGQGSEPSAAAMALTPRTKQAIVAAVAEADQMGQRRIGVGHLLLGLLQEGEGAAFQVLTDCGVREDDVRMQIQEKGSGSPSEEQDLREMVRQSVFDGLTERERDILAMRFGLKDGSRHTLEEVELAFGVSREQIRQVEAKALRRLRRWPDELGAPPL
jgi:RNA polymerase sigma factor (sigma-70 family)